MSGAFADLAGASALVVGGTRGIGFAVARGLAAAGAAVTLVSSGPAEPAAEALAEEFGGPTLGVRADVSDGAAVEAAVGRAAVTHGVPSVLVNSAGVSVGAPAEEMTDDQWQRTLAVNLTGVFYACRAFARARRDATGSASIVTISSMSGRVVNLPQKQVAYNVSKAGVDMLTRTLAVEWLDAGIRVNAVAPGYIATDLLRDYAAANPDYEREWRARIPSGRLGEPDDLVDLVLYLASSRSRYVVGEVVVADGGYSLV